MSRALDNWGPYYDSEGHPLYGRLSFYKLHTTEFETIYNEDGTVPLQNPMPTSQYGMTDVQVFLQDKDYTIKVEKWIGAGAMTIDDPNSEDWEEVRTFDNLYPAILVESPEGLASVVEVSTMNALRQVQVGEGTTANYAKLLGYYQLGDMPPQYYKLVDNMNPTIQDDGGSVIRPEGSTSKVWNLIPQENIDVRVFGVFPSQTIASITAYQSQLHYCFRYANNIGKDVYIPQCYLATAYYFVEGGTDSMWQKLVVDEGVHIVAKPLTTTRLQLGAIQYFGNELFISEGDYGTLYVDCPEVKTSWKGNTWEAWPGTVTSFIVDALNTPFEFDDANVTFTGEVSNKVLVFRNCLIESNHMMKNCLANLDNCGVVTDAWFSGTSNVVFTGRNIVKLANMENPNTYIQWKNNLQEYNYGDMGENTISGVTLIGGSIIENVNLDGVYLSGGSYEMHNASGTASGNGDNISLNLVDCWFTLQNSSASNALKHIDLRRGSFTSSTVSYLNEACLFEDATINSQLITPGAKCTFKRCTINASISTFDVDLIDCQISAPITTYAQINGNTFRFRVEGNTFLQGGYHQLTASSAEAQIAEGYWINNDNLTNDQFVYLNRSVIDPDETHHNYVYQGNRGAHTLQYKAATWSSRLNLQSNTMKGYVQEEHGSFYRYGGSVWNVAGSPNATDVNVYITAFHMFTVGTENIGDLVLTTAPPATITLPSTTSGQKKYLMGSSALSMVLSETERTIAEYQAEGPSGTPFRRGFMFKGGYEWRVTGGDSPMFKIQTMTGISTVQPGEYILTNGVFRFKIEQP